MICRSNTNTMTLKPTFGSHAAVQMRVRPALRLGGGRRGEREGRAAAVEDGGTNRADSPGMRYSPSSGYIITFLEIVILGFLGIGLFTFIAELISVKQLT